jgi:hypothetical protein
MGLEWGPLSLVSTTEEPFGGKSSGSGLEIWDYGHMDQSRWPRGTLYPQRLTSGGRLVGIDSSRTQATEFVCLFVCCITFTRYTKDVIYCPYAMPDITNGTT